MTTRDLSDVLGSVYEAALGNEHWTVVLRNIADLTHATAGSISIQGSARVGSAVSASVGYDPAWLTKYGEHYHSVNIQASSAAARSVPGVPIVGQAVLSDEILMASEYYQDFLRPQDLFHIAGGIITKTGAEASLLAVQRPVADTPFGDSELRCLGLIMSHLERAIRLHRRIQLLSSGIEALDELAQVGVLIVSRSLEVTFSNRHARSILNQNDGLFLDRSERISSNSGQLSGLRTLVAEKARAAAGDDRRRADVLLFDRPSGRRAYQVVVKPAPSAAISWLPGQAAVLFITDPELKVEADGAFLRQSYGLTAKEADLAAVLMSGRDLNAACAEMRITRPTARTHLASLFLKLGVRKQGEMIALLLRSHAGLGRVRDNQA